MEENDILDLSRCHMIPHSERKHIVITKPETVKDHKGNEFQTWVHMCNHYDISPAVFMQYFKLQRRNEQYYYLTISRIINDPLNHPKKFISYDNKEFSSLWMFFQYYHIEYTDDLLTRMKRYGYRQANMFMRHPKITYQVYINNKCTKKSDYWWNETHNYKYKKYVWYDHNGNRFPSIVAMCKYYDISPATYITYAKIFEIPQEIVLTQMKDIKLSYPIQNKTKLKFTSLFAAYQYYCNIDRKTNYYNEFDRFKKRIIRKNKKLISIYMNMAEKILNDKQPKSQTRDTICVSGLCWDLDGNMYFSHKDLCEKLHINYDDEFYHRFENDGESIENIIRNPVTPSTNQSKPTISHGITLKSIEFKAKGYIFMKCTCNTCGENMILHYPGLIEHEKTHIV